MTRTVGIYHRLDLQALEFFATHRARASVSNRVDFDIAQLADQLDMSNKTVKRRTRPAHKAWITSESSLVDYAADLFDKASHNERLALHTSVLIRSYPFFLDVLTKIGEAKNLGSDIRQVTIRDRLQRKYGQEGNVHQGVKKVIHTLVSWEILGHTKQTGVYSTREPIGVCAEVAEVLIACLLQGSEKSALPLETVTNHPAFFAYKMPNIGYTESSPLRIFTEGASLQFVALEPGIDGIL